MKIHAYSFNHRLSRDFILLHAKITPKAIRNDRGKRVDRRFPRQLREHKGKAEIGKYISVWCSKTRDARKSDNRARGLADCCHPLIATRRQAVSGGDRRMTLERKVGAMHVKSVMPTAGDTKQWRIRASDDKDVRIALP